MVTFFSFSFQFGWQVIKQGLLKLHYNRHSENFWMKTNSCFYTRDYFKEENAKFYASLFSCAIVNLLFLFWSSTAPAAQFLYCCVSNNKVLILCVIFVQLLNLLSLFGNVIFFSNNMQATVSCLIEI